MLHPQLKAVLSHEETRSLEKGKFINTLIVLKILCVMYSYQHLNFISSFSLLFYAFLLILQSDFSPVEWNPREVVMF